MNVRSKYAEDEDAVPKEKDVSAGWLWRFPIPAAAAALLWMAGLGGRAAWFDYHFRRITGLKKKLPL